MEPSIPADWKEYSIRYKHGNSVYNIKVNNPNGKNVGVEKTILNGVEIETGEIELTDDGGIYNVEVYM